MDLTPELMLTWVSILGGVAIIFSVYSAHRNYKQQYKFELLKFDHEKYLADQRRRAELFDRRWKVFSAVNKIIFAYYQNVDFTKEEAAEFRRDTSGAKFIFSPEIYSFIESLESNILTIRVLKQRSGRNMTEERTKDHIGKLQKAEDELFSMFDDKSIPEKFFEEMKLDKPFEH